MLKINETRLLNDLHSLAQIGTTPDRGISRLAMSAADVEGRNWFKQRIEESGLIYHVDSAGNQSAILHSDPPSSKRILAGSHLDSVPNGGIYDGPVGTLSAFEALRTIQDAGIQLPVSLEAISYVDEESTVMGLLGSRAIAGLLTEKDFEQPRGGRERLLDGMKRLGLTQDGILSTKRDDVLAFVEVHIEQGTRLEQAGTDIGVVTAIVGIRSYMLRFIGKAAHAGTTPMDRRTDALWGATEFVRNSRKLIVDQYTPGVVNVGKIQAMPGAFNIVPGVVELALEFRHGSESKLEAMQKELLEIAHQSAIDYGLTLEMDSSPDIAPAPMDMRVIEAIETACTQLGLSNTRLMSFAGHDTQSISTIAPAAMFFIPSVDGISHNPNEFTEDQDVVNGAKVMLHTLLILAETMTS